MNKSVLRNDSPMAPEWLSEKKFKLLDMNILCIALKHVIFRFSKCNYFREIFKFRDFMNILRNLAKFAFASISRNLNISRKNLY